MGRPLLLGLLRGVAAAPTTGEEEDVRRGVMTEGKNRRRGVLATLGDDIWGQAEAVTLFLGCEMR